MVEEAWSDAVGGWRDGWDKGLVALESQASEAIENPINTPLYHNFSFSLEVSIRR